MGETTTLQGDDARGGPPGAEDAEWAGRGFMGLGEVSTIERSSWRCLSCPETGSGVAQFDRLAAEDHAERNRHLVLWDYATAFVPEERLA